MSIFDFDRLLSIHSLNRPGLNAPWYIQGIPVQSLLNPLMIRAQPKHLHIQQLFGKLIFILFLNYRVSWSQTVRRTSNSLPLPSPRNATQRKELTRLVCDVQQNHIDQQTGQLGCHLGQSVWRHSTVHFANVAGKIPCWQLFKQNISLAYYRIIVTFPVHRNGCEVYFRQTSSGKT